MYKIKNLDHEFEEELRNFFPVKLCTNGDIVYNEFSITRNNSQDWVLSVYDVNEIHRFKLRTTALIAAKFYEQGLFHRIEEVKSLDSCFWRNSDNKKNFKEIIKKTKDFDRKDMLIARLTESEVYLLQSKNKILCLFKAMFDK